MLTACMRAIMLALEPRQPDKRVVRAASLAGLLPPTGQEQAFTFTPAMLA